MWTADKIMKEWSDVHLFSYPWELMVQAAFRKYPNPFNPNVKSLDTLERRVTPSGELHSRRLFGTLWNVPSIVMKILGSEIPSMHVLEHSTCNLEKKTLTISAKNLSLTGFFSMEETLVYSVDNENPQRTQLRQEARFRVFGVPLLGDYLEGLLMGRYHSTVSNGRKGVELVADQIQKELS